MGKEISAKAIWGVAAAAVVIVSGLVVYLVRGSDPAAAGPIPYRHIDMAAHMQEMSDRQKPAAPSAAH